MFKKICDYTLSGIFWGCTIFVGSFMLSSLTGSQGYILIADFPRLTAGPLLMGLALSFGSIVYTTERLNIFQQVAIHATIFFCTLLITRMIIWGAVIPGTFAGFVTDIAISFAVFAIISFFAYQYHKLEVKEMNEALKKREGQNM